MLGMSGYVCIYAATLCVCVYGALVVSRDSSNVYIYIYIRYRFLYIERSAWVVRTICVYTADAYVSIGERTTCQNRAYTRRNCVCWLLHLRRCRLWTPSSPSHQLLQHAVYMRRMWELNTYHTSSPLWGFWALGFRCDAYVVCCVHIVCEVRLPDGRIDLCLYTHWNTRPTLWCKRGGIVHVDGLMYVYHTRKLQQFCITH